MLSYFIDRLSKTEYIYSYGNKKIRKMTCKERFNALYKCAENGDYSSRYFQALQSHNPEKWD